MAANSKIAWTDHTFNAWVGCSKVSPGCDNCYAEGWAKRAGNPELWIGERRRTKTWNDPVKWNREAEKTGVIPSVFCNSLGDVFDNEIPQEWRDDLFALIKSTPFLRWIILTKRIGNAAKMLPADWGDGYPNVALLITVVNQAEADRDIPKLLYVPALWRGLSVEPQLENISLRWVGGMAYRGLTGRGVAYHLDALRQLNWVIQGCESGPKRRPFELDWARSMRDQCLEAGASYFLKQMPNPNHRGIVETPELDGKTWTQSPWGIP